MSTKTKSIAFHSEGERLTKNAHNPKEMGLVESIFLAILVVGVLYVIGNLVLGWN